MPVENDGMLNDIEEEESKLIDTAAGSGAKSSITIKVLTKDEKKAKKKVLDELAKEIEKVKAQENTEIEEAETKQLVKIEVEKAEKKAKKKGLAPTRPVKHYVRNESGLIDPTDEQWKELIASNANAAKLY